MSVDNKGHAHSFSVKNKRAVPRTQNNATNAWNFNSSPSNNNKSNSNLAVPFYAYRDRQLRWKNEKNGKMERIRDD